MKLMKKLMVAGAFMMSASAVSAAEVSFDLGADVVSQYVWRGVYQGGGLSIQPGMGLEVGGFSVGAWGSTDVVGTVSDFENSCKELDFTVGYAVGGFSIAVTDFYWMGQGAAFGTANYFDYDNHLLEVALGYEFGEAFPLSIGVSTFVYGASDVTAEGKQAYSTYVSLAYPFTIAGVDCSASVGMSLFESDIYCNDSFNVANVSLGASKSIKFSDSFELPVFAELTFAPITADAYFVVGLSF